MWRLMNAKNTNLPSGGQKGKALKISVKVKLYLLFLCLIPMFALIVPAIVLGSLTYFLMNFLYGESNYFTLKLLGKIILFGAVVGLMMSMKNLCKMFKFFNGENGETLNRSKDSKESKK